MKLYKYGNPEAERILIQMVDDHDLAGIEQEIALIREMTGLDFYLLAIKVDSWNKDLSPWPAPAVFGRENFGDGARDTLKEILKYTGEAGKTYYLGGYSLAGLFALWAAMQTDVFAGIAAASPSAWFPDFYEYVQKHAMKTSAVYLSLGDKEHKSRSPVMATVEDKLRGIYAQLQMQPLKSTLEMNPGNHFRDPELRTAKAFAWVLQHTDII
ncbi:MAG: esterase [Mitsuokella sp.]|uniref:esterase n=1 Tax=Mitsuokella sp. TaxID=2049034 RepID=UPI003F09B285